MKKIMFAGIAAIVLSNGAKAQIAKGSIFTGVDLNYSSIVNSTSYSQSSANNSSTTQTNFSITPGIGYFVAEDFVMGISIGYSGSKDLVSAAPMPPSSTPTATLTNGLSFTPYGRRYFNLGEKAAIFMQLNVGYTKTWGTYEPTGTSGSNEDLNNGYIFSLTFTPGLSYFISNKFELEAGIALLGYTATSTTTTLANNSDTQTNKISNLGLNLTMSAINFGFKYYLRKSE